MKTSVKSSKALPTEFKKIDMTNTPKDITIVKAERKKHKKVKPTMIPLHGISNKVSALAEPKLRHQENIDDNHWKIRNCTLKYKASPRILNLAKPKTVVPKVINTMKASLTSTSVTPSALKYEPTQRLLELAKPKDYYEYTTDYIEEY